MNSSIAPLTWLVWAVMALGVAVVFVYVWPSAKAAKLTGVRYWIVRWGHTAVWLLLALSFFLYAWAPAWSGIANFLALAALLMQVIFLMTLLRG